MSLCLLLFFPEVDVWKISLYREIIASWTKFEFDLSQNRRRYCVGSGGLVRVAIGPVSLFLYRVGIQGTLKLGGTFHRGASEPHPFRIRVYTDLDNSHFGRLRTSSHSCTAFHRNSRKYGYCLNTYSMKVKILNWTV